MAGNDSSKTHKTNSALLKAPAIILVEPQLGENIGMAARAMLNCGLTDLRLVNPRDGWPSDSAKAASAGADQVIKTTKIFKTTEEAVSDLNIVFATTARKRDMTNRVVTPRRAASEIHDVLSSGDGIAGVLFGPEAKGLNNEDVAQADAIIRVPVNPSFNSLNLAQAVYVISYECYLKIVGNQPPLQLTFPKETRRANKAELNGIIKHLADKLDKAGFFHVIEKRPVMMRNLRNIFQRASLTEQEARTLRGVISSLTRNPEKSE
jgi:tRNA/rRNA methyltransferase